MPNLSNFNDDLIELCEKHNIHVVRISCEQRQDTINIENSFDMGLI